MNPAEEKAALLQEIENLKEQVRAAQATNGMGSFFENMMAKSGPAIAGLHKTLESLKAMQPKKLDEILIDGVKCSIAVDYGGRTTIQHPDQAAAEKYFNTFPRS